MVQSVEAPVVGGMRDIICLLWSGLVTVNQAAARTRHGKIKISPHRHRFTVYSNQDIKPDCAGTINNRTQETGTMLTSPGKIRFLNMEVIVLLHYYYLINAIAFDYILFFRFTPNI